jgi:hypothetical protein
MRERGVQLSTFLSFLEPASPIMTGTRTYQVEVESVDLYGTLGVLEAHQNLGHTALVTPNTYLI